MARDLVITILPHIVTFYHVTYRYMHILYCILDNSRIPRYKVIDDCSYLLKVYTDQLYVVISNRFFFSNLGKSIKVSFVTMGTYKLHIKNSGHLNELK